MADEKKETWLTYLALTTVLFAVAATLSTFKGGGYSTASVKNQILASDQWAFYQAKSIKGTLYELQRGDLDLQLKTFPGASPELKDEFDRRATDYSSKVKKYDDEKAAIMKDATRLEGLRDAAAKHSQAFGMAVIFLQIAILLSSIAALMKKKPVWLLGCVAGAVGLVHFVNGFLLFL